MTGRVVWQLFIIEHKLSSCYLINLLQIINHWQFMLYLVKVIISIQGRFNSISGCIGGAGLIVTCCNSLGCIGEAARMDSSQTDVTAFKSGGMDSMQRCTSLKSYFSITVPVKVWFGWKKKLFLFFCCKVKLALVMCKNSRQRWQHGGWVRQGEGYGGKKTQILLDPCMKGQGSRCGRGGRNGRGRGIIELQWPRDSTIGEVMCWINSVPDPVFGGALPLGCPRDPKHSDGDTSFWACSSSQNRHSDWQPGSKASLYAYF